MQMILLISKFIIYNRPHDVHKPTNHFRSFHGHGPRLASVERRCLAEVPSICAFPAPTPYNTTFELRTSTPYTPPSSTTLPGTPRLPSAPATRKPAPAPSLNQAARCDAPSTTPPSTQIATEPPPTSSGQPISPPKRTNPSSRPILSTDPPIRGAAVGKARRTGPLLEGRVRQERSRWRGCRGGALRRCVNRSTLPHTHTHTHRHYIYIRKRLTKESTRFIRLEPHPIGVWLAGWAVHVAAP